MSIFRKNKPVHSLYPERTMKEEFIDFWVNNQALIGVIIVLLCICILVYLLGVASATGKIHFISSEANTYEHMEEIVLGGR